MKLKRLLVFILLGLSTGCFSQPQAVQNDEKTDFFGNSPQCRQETQVAIYDDQGTFVVPGCVDYDQLYTENVQEFSESQEPVEEQAVVEEKEVLEEDDQNEQDADFPSVPNNKYKPNQVVMENLNTRVLAYCRGTEEEIETCVKRLQKSCYVKVSEIPYMAAKYDRVTTGTYPTRRWRNGEGVPRW